MDSNKEILRIEKKEHRYRLLSNLTAIALVLFGISWIYFSKQRVDKLKEEEQKLSSIILIKKDSISVLSDSIKNVGKYFVEAQGIGIEEKTNEILKNEHVSNPSDSLRNAVTSKIIDKSIKANNYINKLTKNSNTDSRNNIILRYYKKNLDDEKLEGQLKSLGYDFRSKKSVDSLENRKSNCLWFGASVPEKDIKIVALSLIRSGVEIESIRQFVHHTYGRNYKANIIEITKCPSHYENGPLSLESIYNGESIHFAVN